MQLRLFSIVLAVAGTLPAVLAQTVSAQRTTSFDRDWERYAIAIPNAPSAGGRARQGTTFTSQFNDEHVSALPAADEQAEALDGFAREYPSIRALAWDPVTLPASARDETALNPGSAQFVGVCYYRKHFRLPADGRTYSLRFDGAMQVASVWVNGRFVLQHQGGYLPFTVPLRAGDTSIVVRVDNRNNPNTPPGKPLERLGFLYWSGIYRNVWLVATGPVYITDPVATGGGVFVRYEDVSAASATVIVRTAFHNDRRAALQVRQSLDGRPVVSSTGTDSVTQRFTVSHPHLWSPEDPYLYTLLTEIVRSGRVVDSEVHRIGIRSLRFTRAEGFVLNGKPYRIAGTNRHQDHPYIGNALSAAEQYRDLKRIKEAGMNFVRLAHYPQDPSVFDICDSLGLLVADPIPGWQFFNNSERFRSRVFRDIRETVRRDRNHPCVLLWEMSLNESYPPDSFRIASARVAHQEYPGDQFFTAGDTYGAKHTEWDVPYNSWEDPFGRPQDIQPQQPGLVREYGHYEFGGEASTTNANRARGEQSLLYNAWNVQWEHNLLMGPAYYPWTIGDANWAFYDGFEAYTHSTTDWGVVDVFRVPKFSYYFFRSQIDPLAAVHGADARPIVYIANWWTAADTTGKVVVYANVDSVALFLNGRWLATRTPDDGPDSPYGDWDHGGHSYDGGNGRHLAHPPFTFTGIAFAPGELSAVGFLHGRAVDSAERRTPAAPASLVLDADLLGMPLQADGADVVFVHARVVDSQGTTEVLDNATMVRFTVHGPGVIVGPSAVQTRGGIATIMVRATDRVGEVRVTASVEGKLVNMMEIRSAQPVAQTSND